MWVDPKSKFGLAKNRGKLFSNAMTLREINNSDWEGIGPTRSARVQGCFRHTSRLWKVASGICSAASYALDPATSVSNVLFTQLSELRVVANVISFPERSISIPVCSTSRAGHHGTVCSRSVDSDCFDRICRLQTMEAICATSGMDDPWAFRRN